MRLLEWFRRRKKPEEAPPVETEKPSEIIGEAETVNRPVEEKPKRARRKRKATA